MLSRISGATKNYAWGSKELVPDFFGLAESNEPIAEIWFGTHPLGESKSLPENQSLSKSLGKRLSFLVKVLSAERALSIQVHPNSDQAKAGFDLEQSQAIPISDPKETTKMLLISQKPLLPSQVFEHFVAFVQGQSY